MKPFNLEKALAGEPVRCRDGSYEVLQIFYAPEISDGLTVIALLRERGTIMSRVYFENGRFFNNKEDGLDLFMVTKKRTVWVNLYENGLWEEYSLEIEAKHSAAYRSPAIATAVPVEIEE